MFTKGLVSSQTILKNLDIFYAMIKARKLQKNVFTKIGQQMKPFTDKLQMIIIGLDQWLKENEKKKNLELQKSLLLWQKQLKLREDYFVKLLAQSQTNIPLTQWKQNAIKNIKMNLNQEQQKKIHLCQKLQQENAKFDTTKMIISVSEDIQPTNIFEMKKLEDSYQQIFNVLERNKTEKQNLKHKNYLLIEQKGKLEKQINSLQSQLVSFKNMQQIKTVKIKQQQQECDQLKKKIISLQKNIENLNLKIIFNKSQINNLQHSKNFVEMNVIKLETDLQAAKTTIKHLYNNKGNSNYVNQTIKQLSKHQNQGQQLKMEYTKIKQQLIQWKINYLEVKNQQSEKLQILAKFQSENIRTVEECKRIRRQNKEFTQIIEDQKNQITKLKIEMSKCMQQSSHLRQMFSKIQQQAHNIELFRDQIEQYKNRVESQKNNCICSHQEIIVTVNYLLKSIARINNKQFSINAKNNNSIYKERIQSQPISPIKDFERTLAKLKNTVAVKKENMIEMNVQLTEAVSKCQYYEQMFCKKDEQRQRILLVIRQLLEQKHVLSERYKTLKFNCQKNAQFLKIQADKEIYELRQYVTKMEEENKILIKQQEGSRSNMIERDIISQQSAMFDPIAYRQNLSNGEQLKQQNKEQIQITKIQKYERPPIQNSNQDSQSNSVRQSQDIKRQIKDLRQQLSNILNFCINNKQEQYYKYQITNGIKQIIRSTHAIQGLVVFFKRFVDTQDELRFNDELTQFLQQIQKNIGNLHKKSAEIKELKYITCIGQVIQKLKLLCNPWNIMPISQIIIIEQDSQSQNSVLKILLQQNQNQS